MLTTFYLVRHAPANWTADEMRPLSPRGSQDALAVAAILRDYPIDRIYSSPYTRAMQTITPLADRLRLSIWPADALRERTLGDFGNVDFLTAVQLTWADPLFAFPAGETNQAAQHRARLLVERLLAERRGRHIALSTHGNLLALLLKSFDPAVDFAFWQALTLPDIYTLTLRNGKEYDINRLWH